MKKHPLPSFLDNIILPLIYEKWLKRKAQAHYKRDKKRGSTIASNSFYKDLIHQAVIECKGNDYYTGKPLDWTLISKYNNDESKEFRGEYKKIFYDLPTVDHYNQDMNNPSFKICAWIVNDMKNDLTEDEFIKLCDKILCHSKAQQQIIVAKIDK